MKVLICSTPYAVSCLEFYHLFDQNDIEYVETQEQDDDKIVELSKGCDVIMTMIKPFPEDLIRRLPESIRCIVRVAIGYDIIDVKEASKRNILVCNVPDYCQEEVAVHTMALILSVIRKVCSYNDRTRNGEWTDFVSMTKLKNPPKRLSTLTLGLVGFGGIARLIGKYALGMDMKVIAYDPYISKEMFDNHCVEKVELDELYNQSDVISLHVPLLENTKGMINEDSISLMKEGVYIVNTSRGELVNELDLINALKSQKVCAVGMDVFNNEPVSNENNILYSMENAVTTPHIAYYSEEAFQEYKRKAVEIAITAATGGIPYSTVNRKGLGI